MVLNIVLENFAETSWIFALAESGRVNSSRGYRGYRIVDQSIGLLAMTTGGSIGICYR